MWPDNETVLDFLGFKVHSDLIKAIVLDEKLLPITVGVFGDWGSGKSSIMKMLEYALNPENQPENSEIRKKLEGVACLYFNGWLFEGYDDSKSALLSSILFQIGSHKKFGPKVKESITSLIESVDWMRLSRLGFQHVALPALMAYITGGASILPSIIQAGKSVVDITNETTVDGKKPIIDWEDIFKAVKNKSGPSDVRTFRDRFSKMLDESDIHSLIVLIDDLDRCSPQRIIDNLEAIKLFLSVEKTAFIIGADPRIVRNAIASVYNPKDIQDDLVDSELQINLVNDYLEKLIQVPYHLPRLSPAEVQTYMSLLFCYQALDEETFKIVYGEYEKRSNEDRYSVFGYGAISSVLLEKFTGELAASLKFCTSVAPLITEGLKGNPRQVKRFLNAYVLRKKLADVAHLSNIQDDILVKLMVLEYTDPKRFNKLYKWQASQDGFPSEIKKFERLFTLPSGKTLNEEDLKDGLADWNIPFIKKWITMEPKLAEIDLRDYFWIARDRLQSTLADITLVPPIIRHIFDSLISGLVPRIAESEKIIRTLDPSEIEVLNSLIEQHIIRHPDDKKGYDCYKSLVEFEIFTSAESFANVLSVVPTESIPPAVGVDLDLMFKAKPELRKYFESVIEKLKSSKTKISKVLDMFK